MVAARCISPSARSHRIFNSLLSFARPDCCWSAFFLCALRVSPRFAAYLSAYLRALCCLGTSSVSYAPHTLALIFYLSPRACLLSPAIAFDRKAFASPRAPASANATRHATMRTRRIRTAALALAQQRLSISSVAGDSRVAVACRSRSGSSSACNTPLAMCL